MDKKGYSKKELEIFNGLVGLIRNGANPYLIKVSDIAQASKVGKGTIYDYFSSKEEAISKAILYSVNKEIEYAYSRIKSKKNFKDKFYEILYIMTESLENYKSTFCTLLTAGGIQEFYKYLIDDEYDFSELVAVLNDVIEHLLQTGAEQGVISSFEDDYYKIMVVRGAIAGFSGYINHRDWFTNTSLEEAMDSAYKVLVKALK